MPRDRQLIVCISFWESLLMDKGLLSHSTQELIKQTLKYLKRLSAMEAEIDYT